MENNEDYILLKWGTFKGCSISDKNKKSLDILNKYELIGTCPSVACQQDTPEQKKLLCDAIDVFDGEIKNDWSGKVLTKEEAKKYIMEGM